MKLLALLRSPKLSFELLYLRFEHLYLAFKFRVLTFQLRRLSRMCIHRGIPLD